MPMRTLSRLFFTSAVGACLLLPGISDAQPQQRASTSPQFSYYLLVLSYTPDFCDQPQGNKDPGECGSERHIGFVVHGLWPQGDASRAPENCGPASPVPQAIIQATLKYIPTESLIQHEWTAHGTCSGLDVAPYFAALRKARDSVTLPADLNQPSQKLQIIENRGSESALPQGGVPNVLLRGRRAPGGPSLLEQGSVATSVWPPRRRVCRGQRDAPADPLEPAGRTVRRATVRNRTGSCRMSGVRVSRS
jgi:hypothetical protein